MLKVIKLTENIKYEEIEVSTVWYFFKIQINFFFTVTLQHGVCVCVLFNQWRLNGWLVM